MCDILNQAQSSSEVLAALKDLSARVNSETTAAAPAAALLQPRPPAPLSSLPAVRESSSSSNLMKSGDGSGEGDERAAAGRDLAPASPFQHKKSPSQDLYSSSGASLLIRKRLLESNWSSSSERRLLSRDANEVVQGELLSASSVGALWAVCAIGNAIEVVYAL